MFLEAFKITSLAALQIFLLVAIGYFLFKKNILSQEGLNFLSRLVVEVTLPALIFCNLIKNFSFSAYPGWWVFPLLSIAITGFGFFFAFLFSGFTRLPQQKWQFISLITFQNSGYLPLALITALLPKAQADIMLVYLFLFLLGFNLVMWSLGVKMLNFGQAKRFELGSLFSPPVIATLFSLIVIFFGLNKIMPYTLIKPLSMVGECTLPLAMFVVGGNLASIPFARPDKKAVSYIVFLKLIAIPLLGLALLLRLRPSFLFGLLVIMQLSVPSATSLSVITRHFRKEDLLISQGIFYSHLASIITIPVFLSLYFALVMLK